MGGVEIKFTLRLLAILITHSLLLLHLDGRIIQRNVPRVLLIHNRSCALALLPLSAA